MSRRRVRAAERKRPSEAAPARTTPVGDGIKDAVLALRIEAGRQIIPGAIAEWTLNPASQLEPRAVPPGLGYGQLMVIAEQEL